VDSEDRLRMAGSLVVLAAVILVASIGFASLSDNPLTPDATFEVTDADEEYDLNRTGTVEMLAIEHTGGEAVDISELVVLLGPRSNGIRFNATAGWQVEIGDLTYTLQSNGERVDDSDEFGDGDRLVVAKTSGTSGTFGEFDVRVRLLHSPSRNTLLDTEVTID
jgi:FlaG/FlaF family flagellin (archaellin)